MTRVLIAALVALILSILIGPRFIAFLRNNEFGQHIREEGPEHHSAKSGTPTMGGLMILLSATVAFVATTHFTLQGLTVLFTRFGRIRRDPATAGIPGTGLGLYLARALARAHSGEVSMASQPGAGSVFTLRLPLRKGE